MSRMYVDVAGGGRKPSAQASLDTERSLLGHRTRISWLAREKYRSRRQRSSIGNGEAKLRQVRRSEAGILSRGRRAATKDAVLQRICRIETLGVEGLENHGRTGRGDRGIPGGGAENRDKGIRDRA